MQKRIIMKKFVFLMIAMVLFTSTVFSTTLQPGNKIFDDLVNTFSDKYDMGDIIETSLTNPPLVNEDSKIAWGLSRTILCLLRVYVSTKDIDYLYKAASAIDTMILLRDDKRKASVFTNEQTTDPENPAIISMLKYNYEDESNEFESIDTLELPFWRNMSMVKGIIRNEDGENDDLFPTYPLRNTLNQIIYDDDGIMVMNPIFDDSFDYSQFCYPIESHTGLILFPIIRFVYILDSLNLWEANDFGNDFGYDNFLKENRYCTLIREVLINVVEESFNLINDNQFVTKGYSFYNHQRSITEEVTELLSESSGTYKIREDVFYNTAIQPGSHLSGFSHNAQLGRVGLYLDLVNNYSTYSSRAESLYQYFKDWVGTDDDYAYVWKSRPSGGISDVSHGFYNVDYAKLLYQSDISNINIQCYVNTFLKNIFQGHSLTSSLYDDWEYIFSETVDGESTTQYFNTLTKLPCWAILTQFDPRVYELCYYFVKMEPNYIGLSFVIDEYRNYIPFTVELDSDTELWINMENSFNLNIQDITTIGDISLFIIENNDTLFTGFLEKRGEIWDTIINIENLTLISDEISIVLAITDRNIIGPEMEYRVPVKSKEMEVTHIEEYPVLYEDIIRVKVEREFNVAEPDMNINISGAKVTLSNSIESFVGYTNIYGIVDFNYYATSTEGIAVKVEKETFTSYTGNISPYMWSYSQDATGPNNGNNIIRFNDTGELCMTYYQYDPNPDPYTPNRIKRVIEASSINDGEWWYVYDMGYGQNPSMAITGLGTVDGLHYDNGVGYIFDNATLPSPVTVSNGSMWVEPSSMNNNNITDLLHSTGIKYIDEGTPEPYLIHAVFPYNDPESAIVKKVLGPDGEVTELGYLVIPAHNPSICLFSNINTTENEPIIAFEDINSEICWKWYRSSISEWYLPERKSFSLNLISRNPHIDAYGDNVSLVWEEETGTRPDDYRIYLNNGRFVMDNTETDKRYPKVKRGAYISCVEEKTNVKLYYFTPEGDGEEINIYTTDEEVYYPDFEVKTKTGATTIKHTIYCMYTEKDGNIYRIKTNKDSFYTDKEIIPPTPIYRLALLDTADVTGDSPLYEYINPDNRPVERISSVIKGLNSSTYYEILVKTTNNNKNEPYVLMIDGEVQEVIYGKENEVLIPVNNEYVTDREIIIAVDMTKGNPYRTVDIKVYEYDEVELLETVGVSNTLLKPFKPLEKTTTPFLVVNRGIQIGNYQLEVNVPENTIVKLNIYDVMGREVNAMTKELIKGKNILNIKNVDKCNNELSKGVYFIRIETDNNNYTGKLINLK